MTVAPAVTCGVCATPLAASAPHCPTCGAPTATGTATPPSLLPTLLAGCARASTAQRALAVGTDVLALLALGAVALLDPELLRDLAWLPLVIYVLLTVVGLALTGRTLGHLTAGLRTIDLFTGLPLGLGRLLTAWRADGVTLTVRGARDPLRTTSSARPGSPAARAAQPPVVATSWDPAPGAVAAVPPAAGAEQVARSRRAQRTAAPAAPPQAAAPAQPWGPPPGGTGAATPGPAAGLPARPGTAAPQPAPPAPPVAPSPAPDTGRPGGVVVATADGGRFTVTGTALLGRNPQPRDGEQVAVAVPINDLQRSVSKTHAALRWDGRSLWLTDRGSTNGTVVVGPSGHAQQLRPWEELAVQPGSTIQLGDQTVTVTFPGEGVPR